MRHGWLIIGVAWLFVSCGQQNSNQDTEQQSAEAFIRLPKSIVTDDFMASTGFNPDHKQDDVYAFGYLHRQMIDQLPAETRRNVVELDDYLSRIAFDAKSLAFNDDDLQSLDDLKEGYHNYDQLTAELKSLAHMYPEISELTSAGESIQGRQLWVMKVSDHAATDEDEPKLLYIANMHGDEVVGRELMIYLIRHLLNEYSSNERIKQLVDHAQIYIMPSMNPDGFERGRRGNTNGSDLNRNFPDFISDPRDTASGRQIETQHVMQLHAKHHFVLAINFHGGAVCFNLPWDTRHNRNERDRFGDDPLLHALGREYADTNTHMSTNGGFDRGLTYGYEWYRVTGGMQDWANYYRRSIHATVELTSTKWPSASTLQTHWAQNQEALLQYLERGLRGAHVRAFDTTGNLVKNVAVTIASTQRRSVIYEAGIIHKPTLPGLQTVKLSAPGFDDLTFEVEASQFSGEYTDVVMTASQIDKTGI